MSSHKAPVSHLLYEYERDKVEALRRRVLELEQVNELLKRSLQISANLPQEVK